MFLLNRLDDMHKWAKQITLHPNMFLLNRLLFYQAVVLHAPLHPNMFLLNQKIVADNPLLSHFFTSQYVSIKSIFQSIAVIRHLIFTSQYVSIKS